MHFSRTSAYATNSHYLHAPSWQIKLRGLIWNEVFFDHPIIKFIKYFFISRFHQFGSFLVDFRYFFIHFISFGTLSGLPSPLNLIHYKHLKLSISSCHYPQDFNIIRCQFFIQRHRCTISKYNNYLRIDMKSKNKLFIR
jgi:hypothetical protein